MPYAKSLRPPRSPSPQLRPVREKITSTLAHALPPLIVAATFLVSVPAPAQVVKNFVPVTPEMLLNPAPGDWLMFSRTYDAQRFSPLKQINKSNVGSLRLAWSRGMTAGQTR